MSIIFGYRFLFEERVYRAYTTDEERNIDQKETKIMIRPAKRTEVVKEYYFSRKNKELAALNGWRIKAGLTPIISLGIGAPEDSVSKTRGELVSDYLLYECGIVKNRQK